MMTLRADRLLTRATGNRLEKVDCPGMIGSRPGNMSWAKERDHRNPESGGEMTWPRVGRNQQGRPAHAGFGKTQAELFVSQAHHEGMVRQAGDLAGRVSFGWPTQDQDGDSKLIRKPPGQGGERRARPAFRRSEGPAR